MSLEIIINKLLFRTFLSSKAREMISKLITLHNIQVVGVDFHGSRLLE